MECKMKFDINRILYAAVMGMLLHTGTARADEGIQKMDNIAALLPAPIREAGVLHIAVPDMGKPFAYMDHMTLKGMDVDFGNAVAALMGLKAEISLVPFSSALTGLQAHKFDISYGEFYISKARLKVAEFVTEWKDYSTFLIKKSTGYMPVKLTDICGHTVGAMAGSAELATLKSYGTKCGQTPPGIEAYPSISSAILALGSGRIDSVLINRAGAQKAMSLDAGLDASGEIGGGPTATAVGRNENTEGLSKALQAAYTYLMTSGKYMEILEQNNTTYGAAKSSAIYNESSVLPHYDF